MDARTLSEVMGGSLPLSKYQELLPGYLNAAKAAGITTVDRAAMWAAQLGHESSGLQWMREQNWNKAWQSDADYFARYDNRKDLGNGPGDGLPFRGAGPIQLTGRNNYRAFTKWARSNGHSDIDFEAEPWRLSEPHWGFLAATYYWTAARPQINSLADRRDLEGVTRAINGGLNGIDDRRARYARAVAMGARLTQKGVSMLPRKKVLDYPRDQVSQDTIYNCGPATVQTIVRAATGLLHAEVDLGRELGTHRGGTDWIGAFPKVLNQHLPGAKYTSTEMPNDPPTQAQKTRLWDDIVHSINADYGVVANIVAPPSNYPRAVAPSTIHPAYRGGVVYHYFAVMGYDMDGNGPDKPTVWIADSGFAPFGYWLSFDQLATLIPPKGYAHATAPIKEKEGPLMALSDAQQDELLNLVRSIDTQLQGPKQDSLPAADRNPAGGRGWRQLGSNERGQWLTLVDALAHFKAVLTDLVTRVKKLEEKK